MIELVLVSPHMMFMKFLKKVKVKKAPGPDAISGHVLKNCASVLSSPLAMLFNISYQTGELPDDWKSAYVVPIHKSDKNMTLKIIGQFH